MKNENAEAYLLAGIGAITGFARYYVRPELSAKRGWLAIGALVTAYELACPENELLSEGVDRALDRHRLLTTVAIGITALHLTNLLPESVDPFTVGLQLIKGHER